VRSLSPGSCPGSVHSFHAHVAMPVAGTAQVAAIHKASRRGLRLAGVSMSAVRDGELTRSPPTAVARAPDWLGLDRSLNDLAREGALLRLVDWKLLGNAGEQHPAKRATLPLFVQY
jgi:hypothetical protein